MSTASASPSATVTYLYSEPVPKRRRGRPPKWGEGEKPKGVDQADYSARYGEFEAACRAVPEKGIPALKDWIADRADKDRLTPAARCVLNFLLRRINWTVGCDWHSDAAIAEEKGISTRTVERGRKELRERGYIVMRPIPDEQPLPGFTRKRHGSKPWQTTLPIVVKAVAALGLVDPTEKSSRTRQENGSDPTNNPLDPSLNEAWTRQENALNFDFSVGQTLTRETRNKKTPKGSAKRARARLTEIDPSAELSDAGLAYAMDRGLSRERALAAFSKFKTNARKRGHRFADWGAAWEDWVNDEPHFARRQHVGRASAADIANRAFSNEETRDDSH